MTQFAVSQTFKLDDESFIRKETCVVNTLLFDLGSYEVNDQIEDALKPSLDFLQKNTNLIVEIGHHKDSRGSNISSTCVSCRRAKSIQNYFIAKYINQFKVTNPIRYEELHQLNRRVELKIISTEFIPDINKTEVKLIEKIEGDLTTFSIDNFDNTYTTSRDVIVKYNSTFDTLFSASLKSFIPSSIESSKSFRNLVFDNEKGSVKFLDNTLTEIYSEFDLMDQDILQPVLVCESFNGNAFWVLDEAGMQLLKLNSNLEVVTRIDNLGYLFENRNTPIQMFEKQDQLYIHFPNNGVAIFDIFGTFLKYLPLNSGWIDVHNTYLFALKNNKIEILEFPFLDKITTLDFNVTEIKSFANQKQKFYIQSNSGLYIYSVQEITDNK